jgi:hypothetical protein
MTTQTSITAALSALLAKTEGPEEGDAPAVQVAKILRSVAGALVALVSKIDAGEPPADAAAILKDAATTLAGASAEAARFEVVKVDLDPYTARSATLSALCDAAWKLRSAIERNDLAAAGQEMTAMKTMIDSLSSMASGAGAPTAETTKVAVTPDTVASWATDQVKRAEAEEPAAAQKRLAHVAKVLSEVRKFAWESDGTGYVKPLAVEMMTAYAPLGDAKMDITRTSDQSATDGPAVGSGSAPAADTVSYNGQVQKALSGMHEAVQKAATLLVPRREDAASTDGFAWPLDMTRGIDNEPAPESPEALLLRKRDPLSDWGRDPRLPAAPRLPPARPPKRIPLWLVAPACRRSPALSPLRVRVPARSRFPGGYWSWTSCRGERRSPSTPRSRCGSARRRPSSRATCGKSTASSRASSPTSTGSFSSGRVRRSEPRACSCFVGKRARGRRRSPRRASPTC